MPSIYFNKLEVNYNNGIGKLLQESKYAKDDVKAFNYTVNDFGLLVITSYGIRGGATQTDTDA